MHVQGNQALWFIGIVAGGVALLWFSLIFFDLRSSSRWRQKGQRELLDKLIDGARARRDGLSVEETRQLVSAMERPPRGASGLTRSLLALTIVTLVGVALVATLVSTGSDSIDQRKTIITSLLSVTATITGFYFGARTAQTSTEQATKPPEAHLPTQGPQGPPGVQGPQGDGAPSSDADSPDAAVPSVDTVSPSAAVPAVVLTPDEETDEQSEDDPGVGDTEPAEAPDPTELDGSDIKLADPAELETMKTDADGREAG